jgi:uncharacterized membrane protein
MNMTHFHILAGAESFHARPVVRRIGVADLKEVLASGLDDFKAMPSHAVFLCLIYPILGLLLCWLTLGFALLSLVYPLILGFALIGPFAAIILYELSRERERGVPVDVTHAFGVFRSPSFGAIAALGLLLMVIFLVWLAVAQAIYVASFGDAPISSISEFAHRVFTTPEGWQLIIVGNGVGFLFALLVLTISVVSFPLLLDRDVGAVEAVLTSVRVVWENPTVIAVWGLIVAGALALGSLPLLIGLAIVVPVLGHSTWHLYRKVVEPDLSLPQEQPPPSKHQRWYAAQFPAALFADESRKPDEP